jgi:hypothetical protein
MTNNTRAALARATAALERANALLEGSVDAIDARDRRYKRLLGTFSELQTAAQRVVDDIDNTPSGAVVELRQLLAKQYGLRGP